MSGLRGMISSSFTVFTWQNMFPPISLSYLFPHLIVQLEMSSLSSVQLVSSFSELTELECSSSAKKCSRVKKRRKFFS